MQPVFPILALVSFLDRTQMAQVADRQAQSPELQVEIVNRLVGRVEQLLRRRDLMPEKAISRIRAASAKAVLSESSDRISQFRKTQTPALRKKHGTLPF